MQSVTEKEDNFIFSVYISEYLFNVLFVLLGSRRIITLDELEYIDRSSEYIVQYQLARDPQFGDLMFEEEVMSVGDGFMHNDLSSRRIRYFVETN